MTLHTSKLSHDINVHLASFCNCENLTKEANILLHRLLVLVLCNLLESITASLVDG